MSRTKKSKKSPGSEYWGKRPASSKGDKTLTHRLERLEGKDQIREAEHWIKECEAKIWSFKSLQKELRTKVKKLKQE